MEAILLVAVGGMVSLVLIGIALYGGYRIGQENVRVTAKDLQIVRVDAEFAVSDHEAATNQGVVARAVYETVSNMAVPIQQYADVRRLNFFDRNGRRRYKVSVYVGARMRVLRKDNHVSERKEG